MGRGHTECQDKQDAQYRHLAAKCPEQYPDGLAPNIDTKTNGHAPTSRTAADMLLPATAQARYVMLQATIPRTSIAATVASIQGFVRLSDFCAPPITGGRGRES